MIRGNGKSHFEMVDAVNGAESKRDRHDAELRLEGWRIAADYFGHGWSCIDADLHTMKAHPGATMCCGVLMKEADRG